MNSSYVYNSDENIKFSNNQSFTFELVLQKNNTNGTILFGAYSSEKNINEIWNVNGSTNSINIRFLNCRFPSSGAYQVDVSKPTCISCTYDSESTKLKYYINNICKFNFNYTINFYIIHFTTYICFISCIF